MKVLSAALSAIEAGAPAAMVTVVGVGGSAPRHGGARMLVYPDGRIVGSVGGGTFEHRVIAQAQDAIAEGCPRRFSVHLTRDLGMCCGGEMDAFIEPLVLRETLVVYGAGHVGAAVARLAAGLDYAVTVVDDREELLADARLPPEVHRIEADPRKVVDQLPHGPRAHHLVVTHDHALDQDLVERLLPLDLAWVGLIGSRTKVTRFLIRLKAAGMDPALLRRLCAPVGLDIGAETPEEIALSIVAELIRLRHRSSAPPLPLSEQPLPARGGDGRAQPLAWSREASAAPAAPAAHDASVAKTRT